jgi:two-component system chemotaxis sensor kinase CheA
VKKNIEKLKGRIEVKSAEGLGTTFILHIPLTLAIIDGMLIKVGDASYTIPLLSIRESLRPTEDMITVTPSGQEILRVREEMIPVLRLHNIYNVKPKCDSLIDGLVVIVESGLDVVALLVDELLGQQQTVVKPLSSYLSGAKAVSGCTILGTGEVSLILDIPSLISVKDEF